MEKIIQTGYPHIDKPWEKHYIEDDLHKGKGDNSLFRELYNSNKGHLNERAINFLGGKLSWGDVFLNIDATIKSLTEYGVTKGDYVTAFIGGIPEYISFIYACSYIGAVGNIIPIFDEEKHLSDNLNNSESKLFFCMDLFHTDMVKRAVKSSKVRETIVVPTLNSSPLRIPANIAKIAKNPKLLLTKDNKYNTWNNFIKDGSKREMPQEATFEKNTPSIVLYSSGSSGKSKGVVHSAEAINNKARSYYASGINLDRGMKFYALIPPWFATGASTSYHMPMVYGAEMFLDPRYDREVFVKNLLTQGINYVVSSVSMYEGFLDKELVNKYYKENKKTLQKLFFPFQGGEAPNPTLIKNIQKAMEEAGFENVLLNGYGTSENGPGISTQTPKIHTVGSSGIVLPGMNVKIVDENNQSLKINEPGEIKVHNPNTTMLKYFSPEDSTEEYFERDEQGTKWNVVGDYGFVDEKGELHTLGRKDDYTEVNGKKCYNFIISAIIADDEDIKNVSTFTRTYNDKHEMVVHIILSETGLEKKEGDPSFLEEKVKSIQERIFNQKDDIDWVPEIFKFRDSYPVAKSGKRNDKAIIAETDGFYYSDKQNLIKEDEGKKYFKK